MYNQLKEDADKERRILYLNIYDQVNKKVDEMASLVSRAMSRGETIAYVYNENYIIGINHELLFKRYYQPPYDKSIIDRLKEIFPEPEFRIKIDRIFLDRVGTADRGLKNVLFLLNGVMIVNV